MAEAIKNSIESIFEEIGAAQAHCDVRIFCFSDEDQWIAYTSKEYKMADILDCKHTFSFNWYFDKKNIKPDLPKTVCIHIRKENATSDKFSVEQFWKGNVPYTSESGLVATLLTDTFRPTPELQKGFTYNVQLSDTKQFTIRGHEKNFGVQYRTIEENVNNLKKICKQKVKSCTNLQSQLNSGYEEISSALEEMRKQMGSSKTSDVQKCIELIEKVKSSAENFSRAEEQGIDENEPREILEGAIRLMQDKFDCFGRPNDVKFAIDTFETQISNLEKSVADFKNTIMREGDLKEAMNCFDSFLQVKNAIAKKSNSAIGNVARVYLETQLMLEEDIISHSQRLMWSSPRFNVKSKKLQVPFILGVISKFEKMLKLMPGMEEAMKPNLQELKYNYEHLNINEKYHDCEHRILEIRCCEWSPQLQQRTVMLFNQWFTDYFFKCERTSPRFGDTNQLEAAIVYATTLEQFHVASDATTVRVNEIKYNESHEKERVMHDKQLYLVITSSIMSLCQSNRTECEEFLRLLYFAAHHWNVRRSFGPTQEKSEHRTCLQSLMHFLRDTNRVVERLKSSSKTELRTQLNELYENIKSLGLELEETEQKFQDILSQFKPAVKPIDNSDAMINNLETQIVSDNTPLPCEIQEKVKEFVQAQKNTTVRIDSCRANAESVVKSYNGKHTGKYETLVSDLVKILKCFLSTQNYTDKQKKNITDFTTQYQRSDGTGISNKNIQKANIATKQAIAKLNTKDSIKEYDVGISKAALVHLNNAVSTLNPDALQAVLGRLEHIVPGLCGETEKAPEDKTEKVTCTELDDLGTLDQNADVTVDEIDSFNKKISNKLKNLSSTDEQERLRSCWAKYMMKRFNRTYEQLQEMAMEKDMDKLKEASKHFSLDLVRRQWEHTQSHLQGPPFYFSFYCWKGDPISADPYYTANETHIPCPQMCYDLI